MVTVGKYINKPADIFSKILTCRGGGRGYSVLTKISKQNGLPWRGCGWKISERLRDQGPVCEGGRGWPG
jgi:hypothetical protein